MTDKEKSTTENDNASRGRKIFEATIALGAKAESYITWIGGAAIGNYLVRQENVNAWLAGAGVAIGVAAVELAATSLADKHITETESDTSGAIRTTARNPLLRFAGAAWYGAGVQTAIDKKTGQEVNTSTKLAYSGTYGVAVGAWVAPVPGFEHAVDGMIAYGRYTIEHPYMLPIPAAVAGGTYLVKRHRKNQRHEGEAQLPEQETI